MGGKQSGHKGISPTKLNRIHHKAVINTNRVERIDSTDYNTSCNCEMRCDGDGDGADVGDDVDDDLDDARDDDDDDGDDLPFREVISPAESARRRWLFSSVGFRPVTAAKHGNSSLFMVFTPGGSYRREGGTEGGHQASRRVPGAARRGAALGTLLAAWCVPSPPSSVIPSQSS